MYFVLENDGQKKTPPKEVIPADKDDPTVPEYNPVDVIPAASPAPHPVGGDITTSSAQSEAMYAEITTRSAAKLRESTIHVFKSSRNLQRMTLKP